MTGQTHLTGFSLHHYSCMACVFPSWHYTDVIMGAIASEITSLTIVYSTVYSDADQRKHQSSASLAFVWGIHRGPVNSPHKWPVTRKMFPFGDVTWYFFEFRRVEKTPLLTDSFKFQEKYRYVVSSSLCQIRYVCSYSIEATAQKVYCVLLRFIMHIWPW